jgi:hypothetical protein
MGTLTDLTGQRFGYLLIKSRAESAARRQSRWHCECLRCGREIVASGFALTSNAKRSCGRCSNDLKLRAVFTEIKPGERDQTRFGVK